MIPYTALKVWMKFMVRMMMILFTEKMEMINWTEERAITGYLPAKEAIV